MKKSIMIIIGIVLSCLLTFIVFEAMSWYHFGDIPTRAVLIRLIAFFCALVSISIGIVVLITRKKPKKRDDL